MAATTAVTTVHHHHHHHHQILVVRRYTDKIRPSRIINVRNRHEQLIKNGVLKSVSWHLIILLQA